MPDPAPAPAGEQASGTGVSAPAPSAVSAGNAQPSATKLKKPPKELPPSAKPKAGGTSGIKELEDRVKALETFKTELVTIVAVLAALGLVGGLITWLAGYWTQHVEAAKQAQAAASSASEATLRAEAVTNIVVTRSVGSFEQNAFFVLENLSKSNSNPELLEMLTTDEAAAQLLIAKLDGGKSSDPNAVPEAVRKKLRDLSRLYPLIRGYDEAVKAKAGSDGVAQVSTIIKKWTSLAPEYGDPHFEKAINSHRNNVLGVLQLTLARVDSAADSAACFDRAKEYFRQAINEEPRFAKAYVNMGVAIASEWEGSRKTKDDLKLLAQARHNYSRGLDYTKSALNRSAAHNNIADTYLQEGNWLLANGNTTDAKRAFADAKRILSSAMAQAEVLPIVYITEAELACIDVKLKAAEGARWSADEGAREAERIFGRLELAVQLGYVRLKDVTVASLKADYQNLDYCSAIDGQFLKRIEDL